MIIQDISVPNNMFQNILVQIESENTRYGTTTDRAGEHVLIEFVSANPTSPISVVNGRAAALGDVIANLLTTRGCKVTREFYVNDTLNKHQLEHLAETVEVRYLQQLGHPLLMSDGVIEPPPIQTAPLTKRPIRFPRRGYTGEYVTDIARYIADDVGDRYENILAAKVVSKIDTKPGIAPIAPNLDIDTDDWRQCEDYFRSTTLQRMIALQRDTLGMFGVHYDRWFSESSLYASGAVDQVIAILRANNYAYERDGAVWFRSTTFGDVEDRVLTRANEQGTYIAADAAYHKDKYQRGFTHLIDVFGADHHGYVARLKASIAALGYGLDTVDILLTQMVALVRDGEMVPGGKRKGNVIELKADLLDEIGKDAARFYFLVDAFETPAIIDLKLAQLRSSENPFYRVQSCYTRLCDILNSSVSHKIERQPSSVVDGSLLAHPSERHILQKFADYPAELKAASEQFAPQILVHFALDLDGRLNSFYENCPIFSTSEQEMDQKVTQARLSLLYSARIVLHNLLTLLGITLPETASR